jgi:tetratricopeptide (TPR) repeat protein
MAEYRKDTRQDTRTLVEEATFDFTMGENEEALRKLRLAIELDNGCFDAWHAMAEVYFSMRQWDDALAAGEKALALRPDDLHINTSLSRIWMEKGDKKQAEHFGAQARILGWKVQLAEGSDEDSLN